MAAGNGEALAPRDPVPALVLIVRRAQATAQDRPQEDIVRPILTAVAATALLLSTGPASAAAPGPAARAVAETQGQRMVRELGALAAPYDMSVTVIDNRTGASASYRSRTQQFTASMVKLPTSAAVFLHAYDQGRGVTAGERSLMRRALQVSDNNAESALWRTIGSHSGFARYAARLGLPLTRPSYGWSWGRTRSTTDDEVRLLQSIRTHASPLRTEDEEWILATMRGVAPDQTWGAAPFGRAAGRVIEVKNGWCPYSDNGRWRLNSVGHVRDAHHDYTIAIMSNGWRTMGAGVPRLDAIGRRAYALTSH